MIKCSPGLQILVYYLFPVLRSQLQAQFILFSCFVLTVVTTNGILLTKSGTMTGGTSGGMEARSHKWDDKRIDGRWEFKSKFCLLHSVSC